MGYKFNPLQFLSLVPVSTPGGGGGGSVVNVSVATANGFAGTVTNPTTNPQITVRTTITGVLKGNGTAISAATAGTDYVAPGLATGSGITMSTARLLGRTTASTGAIEEITIGSGLTLSAGVLSASGGGSGITIGTTTITSGTSGRILYDNAGVVGEMTTTGSGTVVALATSPTLVTPVLGVATATSINKLIITAPTTSATLTLVDGSSLITSGANSITLTSTGATNVTLPTTGTLATLAGSETFTNKTITSSTNVLGGVTMTLGSDAANDIYYRNASGILTRLANGTTGQFLGANTGAAPSWQTPSGGGGGSPGGSNTQLQYNNAGAFGGISGATTNGTSLTISSGNLILSGATSGTTVLNSGAIAGSSVLTLPVATDTLVGKATTDTFTNKTYDTAGTGNSFSINGVAVTANTGTGAVARATSPTFVTPTLGVASATSINKVLLTAPATAATLTLADGSTLVTSGANSITLTSTGVTNVTLPTTGTLATLAGSETLTNKTIASAILTGTNQLAENASIGLDETGSADGVWTGITTDGTAGATLVFGDAVQYSQADGRWELCSVSATAGSVGDCRGLIGMCILAAASDGSATKILLLGKIRADSKFPTLTVGGQCFLTTSGNITQTAPSTTDHVVRAIGFATSADEIMFNPSTDWITHV